MMELAGIELAAFLWRDDLSYNPDVDHSLLSRYASTADGWIYLPISRMPIILISLFRFATPNVSRSDCRSVHVSAP